MSATKTTTSPARQKGESHSMKPSLYDYFCYALASIGFALILCAGVYAFFILAGMLGGGGR